MSQKTLICDYLAWKWKNDWQLPREEQGWIRAYELRGKDTPFGFLGHQADRRARELAESGMIEHRIKDKYAEYRYKVSYDSEKVNEILTKYPPRKVEPSLQKLF